jgi:hypothetical protein
VEDQGRRRLHTGQFGQQHSRGQAGQYSRGHHGFFPLPNNTDSG